MRLLHTSDWHLGRNLLGVSMLEHQRDFIDWLVLQVEEQHVDAVLLAGDVFDRALPPVEAVALLESALLRLAERTPVVLISGNHDSAVRLGFAGPLLALGNVHVRASIEAIGDPVVLQAGGQQARIYGIPYLEPRIAAAHLGTEPSHEAVLDAAMAFVRADSRAHPDDLTVVVAHAFVESGAVSESERDVSIGGIGSAPASVFDGADVVALGHLHRPQRISSDMVIAYSGSPLPYSFSEEGHAKQVTLIDLDESGVTVSSLLAPVPRPLRTVTGDLDDLLTSRAFADAEESWVRAVITDARRPEDPMRRLRERFPHVLELHFEPRVEGALVTMEDRRIDPRSADPIDVCAGFITHVTGTEVTEDELRLIGGAIEDVSRGQVGA